MSARPLWLLVALASATAAAPLDGLLQEAIDQARRFTGRQGRGGRNPFDIHLPDPLAPVDDEVVPGQRRRPGGGS